MCTGTIRNKLSYANVAYNGYHNNYVIFQDTWLAKKATVNQVTIIPASTTCQITITDTVSSMNMMNTTTLSMPLDSGVKTGSDMIHFIWYFKE